MSTEVDCQLGQTNDWGHISPSPFPSRKLQRGSAMVEFTLCMGLLWLPLFLGATQFGFNLIQSIQVTQVCRDSGHLYAYGINFSQSSNKYLLASFSPMLNIDPTGAGGSSVVILSTVQYVSQSQCTAGGYSSTCPNINQLVFTNQQVIGNASLHASLFGAPVTNSYGNVAAGSPNSSGYLNAASALVSNYPNISLSSSTGGQQSGYIAEVYSQDLGLKWLYPGSGWVSSVSYF